MARAWLLPEGAGGAEEFAPLDGAEVLEAACATAAGAGVEGAAGGLCAAGSGAGAWVASCGCGAGARGGGTACVSGA
jgi:hypothetical protein